MQIVIEIPDDKLTQTQSVLDISLDIISGKVFSADGYGFCILPKNHGRLIDQSEVMKIINSEDDGDHALAIESIEELENLLNEATTVLEGDVNGSSN